MKQNDCWRIPLASGLGGFVGSWISFLIPTPSIWMTLLSLFVGGGVGWLVGYVLYSPSEMWLISYDIEFLLSMAYITTFVGMSVVMGVITSNWVTGFVWFILMIIGFYVAQDYVYNNLKLHDKMGKEVHHIFEISEKLRYGTSVSIGRGGRIIASISWAMLCGANRGIWFCVGIILVKTVTVILVIPTLFYQLIRILNCQQRIAAGSGGLIGTILGFLLKAPHFGFLVGAITGWFGWYMLNRLPGISINKMDKATVLWLKNIFVKYLSPSPIPESIVT